MSETDDHMPENSKPNRLSGLVAPKGGASRPAEQPQRASEVTSTLTPPPAGMGAKSLTLRLSEGEYERLRVYAFAQRKTHQAVLAEALKAHLDAATS